MRSARRQVVLGVVCCGTRPSSRVRACAPPVQHLLRGGYKRRLHAFQGGQRHHGRFGTPEEEMGGGRGETTAGESVLAAPLWGIFYADDDGVVSQPPEQVNKMMGVIVVVCAAFGLTVSEAKTEIMCLRVEGMPESTATFSVEAAARCTTRRTSSYTSGGKSTTIMPTCPSRLTGAYSTRGAASGSTPSNCMTDRALPPSSKS